MANSIKIFFPVKSEVINTVIERGVLFALPGRQGIGIPEGGAVGQLLRKNGTADYALEWFTPAEAGITAGDIANWNAAYGWGDHAAAGYLTEANAAASYQPLNAGLSSIAGLAGSSGLIRKTGANTYALDTAAYLTAETDPVFLASAAAGITGTNISNWNTAYSWGNHASEGYLASALAASTYVALAGSYANPSWLTSLAWAKITGAPSFLTSETDPVFSASPAAGITGTNITNWNTAYGWGNHASAGYATTSAVAAGYQPLDGDLTAIASVFGASGILRKTGANTWSLDANSYLMTSTAAATYQPLDADLTAIAGLAGTSGLLRKTAADTWALDTTAFVDQAGARSAISLTTTGTSGAATYNSTTGVLNIPQYTGGGGSLTVGSSAISSGTAGRILFEGAGNVLSESANLVWDDAALSGAGQLSIGGAANALTRATFYATGTNTYSLALKNSSGANRFTVRDDGRIDIEGPGGAQYITGIAAGFYRVYSPNGPSSLNLSGGLFDCYDDTGVLGLRMLSTYTAIKSPTRINDTIGAPDASAMFQVDSTTRGFLPPRMTTTERNAIGTPATGLILYNTTTDALTYRNASGWVEIGSGGSESDPIFSASAAAGITSGDITDWDTAFSWGNHASAGYLTSATAASTYQPMDGDLTAIAALAGTSGLLRKTAADTWTLDTASYLTSFTETDPIFTASAAFGITGTQVSNWDTAFGWGNHASAGYVTQAGARSAISLTTTGTSGAATYNSTTGVLNVPNYASSGSLTVGTSAIGSGTAGRILFEGAGNVLSESANLVWDDAALSGAGQLAIGGAANAQTRATFYATGTNTYSLALKNSVGANTFIVGNDGLVTITSTSGTSGTNQIDGYGMRVYRVRANGGFGNAFLNLESVCDLYSTDGTLGLRVANTFTGITDALIVGATSAPDASAMFQVDSTTRGFLPPRMTTTERNAISTPAAGLVLYNTTTGALTYRNASTWVEIGAGGSETDPVFTASAAFGIAAGDITNWDTAFGWGNHASAGYATTSAVAAGYQPLDGDLTAIAALAGTTGLLRKTAADTWALDTTAFVDQAGARSAISLTTTGTSGVATYSSGTGVFNIPNYGAATEMVRATPGTDQTAVGPVTSSFNAGATITIMDLVYLGSSSTWLQADADAATTAGGMLAMALEAKTSGQAMKVALPGTLVRNDAWNWTPGQTLYVSTTAAGIATVAPSGTDDVVRVIGFALTADVIFFNPSPDYITIV